MTASNALRAASPLANPAAEVTSTDSPAPRLLIVDDTADNRTVLARRFQRRGFDITEAEDGMRALELIEKEAFDLVLLDVMMPGVDGIEVLKRIRKRHSPVSLPVIMVTAKSQSEDVVEALQLGANDYVTKPVDFPVALARASVQIGRKRAEEGVLRANAALQEANESLEQRVADRTAKLAATNDQLRLEIEHRQQSEAKVHYLAHHDALTGLANRVLFREQLDEALARARRTGEALAVLFLDLDGFKGVNDTLGHSLGDALLNSVADRLRGCVRDTDKIARLGGDEFAILQTSLLQPKNAAALAQRVIEVISAPCTVDGHQVVIGASVGIAVSMAGDNADAEQLLKSADLAMYRAKAEGRDGYRFFEPEMDAQAQARRILEMELRQSLTSGGFELHYQPVVNISENKVTGFEALLRWTSPTRGRVSPAEFVPVAEETGLIIPLGEWVLRQACSDAVTWPEDVKVAVNLSTIQFRSGLVPAIVNALAESGLPATRLELEITESVLLEKKDAVLDLLRQIHELGVKISMDDFGTGYSSLSYLRSFPFDKIKIDQSFIRDLSDDGDSRAIVRAIAALGDSFHVTTTAEGVETEQQLRCLKFDGCTEIQGYLVSPPKPASEIPQLLKHLGNAPIKISNTAA